MTHKDNYKEIQLPLVSKLCFALAGLPYQLYFSAISVFISLFLLEAAKIRAQRVTYILFVSRIIDALTDPIYGFLINKSKITKYGRLKPWIMVSMPITALSYVMMWYAPDGFSSDQLFVWFLLWHSVFFTVITGIRIPHTSMTMFLCSSQEQRESATVYRMGFEMIGILLSLAIQGPFMSPTDCKNITYSTFEFNSSAAFETTMSLTSYSSNMPIISETSSFEKNKYTILACGFTLIFVISTLSLLFFVKERTDIVSDNPIEDEKSISTIQELKQMFTFKPFLILFSASLLNTFSIQIVQANLQLYFEYGYTEIKHLFTPTILGILILATLLVPFWQYMMRTIGKKKSFIAGSLSIVPGLFIIMLVTQNEWSHVLPFYVCMIIGANTFTVTFLVPWAMLPECVDEYYLKFNTKPDTLFYTFFILGTKVLMAIYLGLTALVLDVVGYQNGICAASQLPNVRNAIIYLTAPTPLICLILCSIIIHFYPIDEAKAFRNTERIREIKFAHSTKSNMNVIYMPSKNDEKQLQTKHCSGAAIYQGEDFTQVNSRQRLKLSDSQEDLSNESTPMNKESANDSPSGSVNISITSL